ncbi:MAG TPA: hypothetical protein VIZ90_13175, partial [Rhizobiaceae bacterium]
AEVRQRFREAAAVVVGEDAADEIEGVVDGLEDAGDAGELPKLCSLTTVDGVALKRRKSRPGRAISSAAPRR